MSALLLTSAVVQIISMQRSRYLHVPLFPANMQISCCLYFDIVQIMIFFFCIYIYRSNSHATLATTTRVLPNLVSLLKLNRENKPADDIKLKPLAPPDQNQANPTAMAPPPRQLPEELVEEILLRFALDRVNFLRASLVCKAWCRLVYSPRFLRRRRQFKNAGRPRGCLPLLICILPLCLSFFL